MNVTLLSTADAGGGAPIASMRILQALDVNGVKANMLVQHKVTRDTKVTTINGQWANKLKIKFNFLYERVPFILFRAKSKSVRFAFSTACTGTSVANNKLVKDADVLHFHWTNSGYLSLKNLQQVVSLNKPVVWTLHDMWAFTGGCHYAGTCENYTRQCGTCSFLKNPHDHDISHTGWMKKMAVLAKNNNIVFVAVSHWLANIARKSSLLNNFRIETIANPIDTKTYTPQDKQTIRRKWQIAPQSKVILFGALNITDRRKGLMFLVEALQLLKDDYQFEGEVEMVVFGKNKHFDISRLAFKTTDLKVITSQKDMAEIYSMADVFVCPSLEDNLPNTIMESLACATPVVSYNTGGIPEMIDHLENGYLAQYQSVHDLARGIWYVLSNSELKNMGTKARQKVMDNFTEDIIGNKYISLFNAMLAETMPLEVVSS